MTLEHLDTIISFVAIITGVSMIVTTLTQAVSALLGLRGTNLRWGVEMLLKHADPGLADQARTISEKVLHHDLVSDSSLSKFESTLTSRWRLATGIRQDELIAVLRSLAASPATTAAGAQAEPWAVALQGSMDALDRSGTDRLLQLVPVIRGAFPNDAASADAVIAQLTNSAETVSENINRWFDSVMDRVSQRFALHTRVWTIIFGLVLAFALHLDTFRMFTALSSDSELRGRVLASADALTQNADAMLVGSQQTPSAAYVDAMQQLIAGHTELKSFPQPSGFSTLAGAEAWLSKQLTAVNVGDPDKWIASYVALVPQSTLRLAADQFKSVLDDKLKLQLVPDPYPDINTYWTPNLQHFWGTLASAALLSLGAPFWFNMLKDLSSLRPVLAKKQDEENAQDSG
jgi:hypothetical protein